MLAGLIAAAVAALLNHAHEVGGPDAIQEAADAIRKAVDEHALPAVDEQRPSEDDHPMFNSQ